MTNIEIFEAFASTFIRSEFRERFAHEATKKPGKLLERVCHESGQMFEATLANGSCSYQPSESCLILSGLKGFVVSTWAHASRAMGLGDGFLVIGSGGSKFYAETEASKGAPSVVFAGAANHSFEADGSAAAQLKR